MSGSFRSDSIESLSSLDNCLYVLPVINRLLSLHIGSTSLSRYHKQALSLRKVHIKELSIIIEALDLVQLFFNIVVLF
jgi:hypothetical protein